MRARRLARSHLLERAPAERLVEVARDVCGIHAQVGAAAELSLAARVAGVTQQDVREALRERRTLAKTWTLRGTLHLHPADELRLWTAARQAVQGAWWEAYELDEAQGRAVLDAVGSALDGRCLLREELADEVARRVGPGLRERMVSGWGYVLGDAALAGLLCHGPPRGAKVTFVRPDQWLGASSEVEPAEALREVCRRYLAAYGPATHTAFSEWFGHFKPAEARRLLESLGDELEPVDVEGKQVWRLRGDDAQTAGRASVRLLPEYDCYVMGFREREHLVPAVARARLASHGRGRYEGPAAVPWLLVDGAVAGMWQRRRRGKWIELRVEAFTRVPRAALEAEADRIATFLAAETELVVGSLAA